MNQSYFGFAMLAWILLPDILTASFSGATLLHERDFNFTEVAMTGIDPKRSDAMTVNKKGTPMSVRLSNTNSDWKRKHSLLYGMLWRCAEFIFISNQLQISHRLRALVLRWFGATIGADCLLAPFRVRFPYNLYLGDRCWIGEQVHIYNPSKFTMGSDSALNHELLIVTGSHDIATMGATIAPITIGTGVWLSSRTIIISNESPIIIEDGVIVTPGTVICRSLAGSANGARAIYGGNPVRKLREQEQLQYDTV